MLPDEILYLTKKN